MTIDQSTHDKLERAQALLRHRLPSGDFAQVIELALEALLTRLEKEKFAVADHPRSRGRARRVVEESVQVRAGEPAGAKAVGSPEAQSEPTAAEVGEPSPQVDEDPQAESVRTRHVPADVRRGVHERDGEQCTFVSTEGVRCTERGFLEFDHTVPFARGGRSTEDRIRILCRAHNQYEAERQFGKAFMVARRRRRAVGPIADRPASSTTAPPRRDLDGDTLLGLRGMGVTPADARDAVARSADAAATTLEERLRVALRALRSIYANRVSETWRPWPRWGSSEDRAAAS